MTTTTLATIARKVDRTGRRQVTHILEGGLANGRTERRLTVLGTVNGHVVVQQGLTADQEFVRMERAETITVETA